MAEYIEREAVVMELNKTYDNMNAMGAQFYCSFMNAVHRIKDFPAADVAPVRHGRWMNANSRPKTYWRKCTACGGLAYFCGIGCSYKYCQNCGCRMDGGAD